MVDKTCSCGAVHDERSWKRLEYVGDRNCPLALSRLVTDTRYPSGHVIAKTDRARIDCDHCGAPAERCLYSRWAIPTRPVTKGVSFFKFCARCWITEGPDGTSPRDRAWQRAS